MSTEAREAIIKENKDCRSCGSADLIAFFNLGNQPFANSLPKSVQEPESAYPLALAFCNACGLVQLTHTADPKTLFSHYVWVTGTSATARRQAGKFCADTLQRMPEGYTPRLVVELASNDGTFLRPYMERNIPVLGIDPAANVAKEANAAGVPTLCAFFDESTARKVLTEHGTADIVAVRNVLPHVAALHSFVDGVAELIGNTGTAAIEFHYGHRILAGLQYDSIYHEHLCYFTAGSVQRVLARSGLEIVDLDEGPIGGGALIVYARRKDTAPKTATVGRFLEAEKASGSNTLAVWQEFGHRAQRHRDELTSLIDAELAAGRRVAGYGASARSSTMLNFCGIDHRRLFAIADANSMKQGRVTAGTHIPILSPADVMAKKPDTVLLLAWNFRDELISILRDNFNFGGRIISPLPNKPVVEEYP